MLHCHCYLFSVQCQFAFTALTMVVICVILLLIKLQISGQSFLRVEWTELYQIWQKLRTVVDALHFCVF